jgi:hypothetical protein
MAACLERRGHDVPRSSGTGTGSKQRKRSAKFAD